MKTNSLIKLEDVQARLTFKSVDSDKTDISATGKHCKESNEEDVKPSDMDLESPESCVCVHIPATEYILGVADLTGEMMRRAINSVGSGDLERPFDICSFLQEIEAAYCSLGNANREVSRKLHVLRQSLRKVETACYTLKVRGSEVPKHMLVDMISKTSINQFNMEDSVTMDDD